MNPTFYFVLLLFSIQLSPSLHHNEFLLSSRANIEYDTVENENLLEPPKFKTDIFEPNEPNVYPGAHTNMADPTDEQLLIAFLLRNYSSLVRPVQHANKSLTVVVRIYLIKILDLVERDQVLHLVLRFQLGWTDLSLTWDPREFGNLTSIILPGSTLWIPDIQTGNSADDRYGLLRNRVFPFKIHNNGEVWWHVTGSIFTRCSLDLVWFPFDYQQCPIVLESSMHNYAAVNLTVRPNKTSVVLTMYTGNSLWDLIGTSGTSYYYRSSSFASAKIYNPYNYRIKEENNYTRVVFWLNLKRKTNYYKLNVLYPCAMLTTMQLLTFLLPLDSLIRVHQANTILLSVIIFQAVIVDDLPKSSDNLSLISVYTTLMIATSVVAIVESVFVANLVRRKEIPICIPKQVACLLRIFLKTPKPKADNSPAYRPDAGKLLAANIFKKSNLESVKEEDPKVGLQPIQSEGGRSLDFTLVDKNLLSAEAASQDRTSYNLSLSEFDVAASRNPSQDQSDISVLPTSPNKEVVVVNWEKIAVMMNCVALGTCVLFVVIIPSILMMFV